jgi:hypothetical protein
MSDINITGEKPNHIHVYTHSIDTSALSFHCTFLYKMNNVRVQGQEVQ